MNPLPDTAVSKLLTADAQRSPNCFYANLIEPLRAV